MKKVVVSWKFPFPTIGESEPMSQEAAEKLALEIRLFDPIRWDVKIIDA